MKTIRLYYALSRIHSSCNYTNLVFYKTLQNKHNSSYFPCVKLHLLWAKLITDNKETIKNEPVPDSFATEEAYINLKSIQKKNSKGSVSKLCLWAEIHNNFERAFRMKDFPQSCYSLVVWLLFSFLCQTCTQTGLYKQKHYSIPSTKGMQQMPANHKSWKAKVCAYKTENFSAA